MNTSLARFQDDFVAALDGAEPLGASVAGLVAQPGFAVYRNTVFKGCVDALAANFPSVVRLVGEAWFNAAAMDYARCTPPDDARLVMYGATFPAFLAQCEASRGLTYLADVARLDRLWCESHTAAEEDALDAAAFAQQTPESFERMHVRAIASARWAWFEAQPIYTIWHANRTGEALPESLEWRGEGVLMVRQHGAVRWQALGPGGCALLDACAAGFVLGAAMERVLAADPAADLGALFATLVSNGALALDTAFDQNSLQSKRNGGNHGI
jgi:hypothetical protein